MLYDVTLPLSAATLRYPGDPAPVITRTADTRAGDPLTVSHVTLTCHTGTHVDAPAHFLSAGATVDGLPLTAFFGPAVVLALPDRDVIRPADLARLDIPTAQHVVLKTRNSFLLRAPHFADSYCSLTPDAAALLCERRPRSIGFDYYTLDPLADFGFPAHRVVAAAGLPVFVCLALADVPPGAYTFAGLPLSLVGAEAAPVRALLIG